MSSYDVAHIRQSGVDLIIIPLDRSFGFKPTSEQHRVTNQLQLAARSAGLAGTVVPVWDAGGGRMAFIAPRPWHPFFSSIGLHDVAMNINLTLTCH